MGCTKIRKEFFVRKEKLCYLGKVKQTSWIYTNNNNDKAQNCAKKAPIICGF